MTRPHRSISLAGLLAMCALLAGFDAQDVWRASSRVYGDEATSTFQRDLPLDQPAAPSPSLTPPASGKLGKPNPDARTTRHAQPKASCQGGGGSCDNPHGKPGGLGDGGDGAGGGGTGDRGTPGTPGDPSGGLSGGGVSGGAATTDNSAQGWETPRFPDAPQNNPSGGGSLPGGGGGAGAPGSGSANGSGSGSANGSGGSFSAGGLSGAGGAGTGSAGGTSGQGKPGGKQGKNGAPSGGSGSTNSAGGNASDGGEGQGADRTGRGKTAGGSSGGTHSAGGATNASASGEDGAGATSGQTAAGPLSPREQARQQAEARAKEQAKEKQPDAKDDHKEDKKDSKDKEKDAAEDEPPKDAKRDAQTLKTLQALGWALLVVILALVALALWRWWAARREDAPEEAPPESALLDALRERAGEGTPDALAAAGRFDEAIHALLLDALSALITRRRALAAPSLTSRELTAQAPVDEDARAHLMVIVRAVELCVFARRAADRALFDAARAAHTQLMPALHALPPEVSVEEEEGGEPDVIEVEP